MDRRRFLAAGMGLAASASARGGPSGRIDAEAAIASAHREIGRRFLDEHGVMLDFAGLDGQVDLPTPEECRAGKPNALGWFQPIENGPMFTGLYLDAAVNRWKQSRDAADAAKARRLMEGLLLMASVSEVPGLVARGVSTDGRSHFPMGSDDQTIPWFLGLWRYLEAGLATDSERRRIVAKLVEVADAIVARDWSMPAEPPFGRRGSFAEFAFDGAPRLLAVARILHAATGEAAWETRYRKALAESGGPEGLGRLAICERGMVYTYAKTHTWTSGSSVAALRVLWEREDDPATRAAFARGLEASADLAAKSLPLADRFDLASAGRFSNDWRTPMMPLWTPQATEKEAVDLALRQLREYHKIAPRRQHEADFVREPTSAAWIVTLAADPAGIRRRAEAIERVITRYDYAQLHYSTFFWVESAWWRLRDARRAAG